MDTVVHLTKELTDTRDPKPFVSYSYKEPEMQNVSMEHWSTPKPIVTDSKKKASLTPQGRSNGNF